MAERRALWVQEKRNAQVGLRNHHLLDSVRGDGMTLLILITIALGITIYILGAVFTNGWWVGVHGRKGGTDNPEGLATLFWPVFWIGWLIIRLSAPVHEWGEKVGKSGDKK